MDGLAMTETTPPSLITRDEDIERASRSLKAMSSNISQHLAILRDKGILFSRKDANRVYYKVGDARTLRLIDMMREVFCTSEL